MKSSGCIKNYYVVIILLGVCYRSLSNIYRVMSCSHRKYFNALLITIDSKLFYSCWSVYITSYEQRLLALGFELSCKLGCSSCLTSTLKTRHHNDSNFIPRLNSNLCCLRAHKGNHLFINYLNNHLSRCKT